MERQKLKDVTTLLEDGAINQGRQEAYRSWKKQENRFSPTAFRMNTALLIHFFTSFPPENLINISFPFLILS